MTKSTSKKTERPETSYLLPQMEMSAFNGNLFSAYTQMGQAFVENAVVLNQEMIRFLNERLQADAQELKDLQQCTSWKKAITTQSDFVRSSADSYSMEMPRLMELTTRTCTAMWAPLLESAKALPEAVAKT